MWDDLEGDMYMVIYTYIMMLRDELEGRGLSRRWSCGRAVGFAETSMTSAMPLSMRTRMQMRMPLDERYSSLNIFIIIHEVSVSRSTPGPGLVGFSSDQSDHVFL